MKIPDLNDLIADLQTAKQIAIVTATVAQAKLLGMDNMRDVTLNSNIKSGLGHFYGNREPEPIADYSTLTDDELRQLQTITEKMQRGDNV